MLWSEVQLTSEQIDHVMDTLQSCVVSKEDMPAFLKRNPQAIVLRNNLKPFLNRRLALNQAHELGERVIMWRAIDICAQTKRKLSVEALNELDRLAPDKTGDIPTYNMFFPGCKYVFSDNESPALCWVNNYTSTGVRIILDKEEPVDDLSQPYWLLKKPPAYVCVRPDNTSFGRVIKAKVVPDNCLPVGLKTATFEVGTELVGLARR
jgi:hypothetical protein